MNDRPMNRKEEKKYFKTVQRISNKIGRGAYYHTFLSVPHTVGWWHFRPYPQCETTVSVHRSTKNDTITIRVSHHKNGIPDPANPDLTHTTDLKHLKKDLTALIKQHQTIRDSNGKEIKPRLTYCPKCTKFRPRTNPKKIDYCDKCNEATLKALKRYEEAIKIKQQTQKGDPP